MFLRTKVNRAVRYSHRRNAKRVPPGHCRTSGSKFAMRFWDLTRSQTTHDAMCLFICSPRCFAPTFKVSKTTLTSELLAILTKFLGICDI
jgi:hypothetical protein